MNLIDYLQSRLQCTKLLPFCERTHNMHYFGFSQLVNKEVFVKVFTDKKLYNNELHIYLNYKSERLIDYIEFEDKYIIIIELQNYAPFIWQDDKCIKEAATVIADFHKNYDMNLKPIDLYSRLEKKFNSIKKNTMINQIYEFFILNKNDIEEEYSSMNKTIIHSDFGERNLKYNNGIIELIDFERIKVSIPWLDFVKIFVMEITDQREQNIFLDEYQKLTNLERPSKNLIGLLNFIEALGMIKYLSKIESDVLEKSKDKILSDLYRDSLVNESETR